MRAISLILVSLTVAMAAPAPADYESGSGDYSVTSYTEDLPASMEVKPEGNSEPTDKNWDMNATMEESYDSSSDGGSGDDESGSPSDSPSSYDDGSKDKSRPDQSGGSGGAGNSTTGPWSGDHNSTTGASHNSSTATTGGASNSTSTGAGASSTYQVAISPDGYSPKDLSVKKGDTVTFTLKGAGPYSVTQSTNLTACSPMSGGFDSKMLTGVGTTWNWTVPTTASSKVYVYSAGEGHCQTKNMTMSFSVLDNLVAGNTSTTSTAGKPASVPTPNPTLAGTSDSAAGSLVAAPVFATVLAFVAATFRF